MREFRWTKLTPKDVFLFMFLSLAARSRPFLCFLVSFTGKGPVHITWRTGSALQLHALPGHVLRHFFLHRAACGLLDITDWSICSSRVGASNKFALYEGMTRKLVIKVIMHASNMIATSMAFAGHDVAITTAHNGITRVWCIKMKRIYTRNCSSAIRAVWGNSNAPTIQVKLQAIGRHTDHKI